MSVVVPGDVIAPVVGSGVVAGAGTYEWQGGIRAALVGTATLQNVNGEEEEGGRRGAFNVAGCSLMDMHH